MSDKERKEIAIDIHNLHAVLNSKKAIDGLSILVYKNEIVALLSRDYEAKRTFFEVCSGLLIPQSGKVEIMSYDVIEERDKVIKLAAFGQINQSWIYKTLSVYENLVTFGKMLWVNCDEMEKYISLLLELGDLESSMDIIAGKLDDDMKRILNISMLLMKNPEILFLESPTFNLSGASREKIWKFLKKLSENDRTIVFSTDDINEAEVAADWYAIMDCGRIIVI